MDRVEALLAGEYLFRATPEVVYEWYKARPKRDIKLNILSEPVPEGIEVQLISRNNEIIDLALAAWGTNFSTALTLYYRWCPRSIIGASPASCSSYSYTMLAALLSNTNAPLFPWRNDGIPNEELDWLFEVSEEAFTLMHRNPTLAYGLLKACSEKTDSYARMSDERWLSAFAALGASDLFLKPKSSFECEYERWHNEIHAFLVQAAIVCPKTCEGADKAEQVFRYLPIFCSTEAYVDYAKLTEAIDAWDIEIDATEHWSLNYSNKLDALTPVDRVRFHLLRHYCSYLYLDPDDPKRVNRLAAYALNPINGGRAWSLDASPANDKYQGKGLDKDSFQRYAERDGAAFMYACSFNEKIWGEEAISKIITGSWDQESFSYPYPDETREVYFNRDQAKERAEAKKTAEMERYGHKPITFEQQTLASFEKVNEEFAKTRNDLTLHIDKFAKWTVKGGILSIVLLFLLLFFKH